MDNNLLTATATDVEIETAIFQMDPTKSPGPDGFNAGFFHHHWEMVRGVVIVLTNRLKRVLPKVISQNQSVFVAGRQIFDNILVVHELLHSMQHGNEDGVNFMAMKLDMAKAYDRVEWSFLNAMMHNLGFADILSLGDGVCANERVGCIRGMFVTASAKPISHVFFMDDSVLFCRALESEAQNGLKAHLSQVLGIGHQEGFGKYLGIQSDFRASKRKVFEEVQNRLDERINRWAEQFWSVAGKEVLIKSVAAAFPIYTISCFQLPIQLAKEIEQVIARFWWRDQKTKKGIHWVAWNKVAKTKASGELGFKEIIDFNLALLAKTHQWAGVLPGVGRAYCKEGKY
ncbi:uncharacterized protein [Malus domestica]|uniref:uncharacterized protein n=1 Tax=Malus domestica TaxID=3750 RepID=UPI0039768DAD